jgi:hypothetical protein
MNDNFNKEQYPIELPPHEQHSKHSPIVDVTENVIFPMEVDAVYKQPYKNNGLQIDNITEVVATEIEADKAEQTIHE